LKKLIEKSDFFYFKIKKFFLAKSNVNALKNIVRKVN